MGKEGKLVKRDILFLVSLSILFGFIVFVLATSTMTYPLTSGNYTSPLGINITVDANGVHNITNITCYYNTSGGAATTFLTQILNDSSSDLEFANVTISTTSFADTRTCNISCSLYNSTTLNSTITIANVTIDNTAPNVTLFGTYSTYVNSSIVVSSIVNDSLGGLANIYVRYNITYSNGTQANFSNATTDGTTYYNLTINTSSLADGVYNITVYANESYLKYGANLSGANLNNSEKIQIIIDNTAPTVTYTCSPNTTVGQIVTCTCTATDPSEVNYTSDTDTTGSSSITTTITARSTGTFSRTCTAKDKYGRSGSAIAAYKITDNKASGGSSSSTSKTSTFTYSKTIAQSSEDLSTMKTIETSSFAGGGLGAKEKVTFSVKNQAHYIGVRSLTVNSVTIEIASDPIQINLGVGVETKQDLDGDGYYDIAVKLNSITNGKADLSINYIQEKVTSTTTVPTEPTTTPTEPTGSKPSGISAWVWIIIVVIILAAIVAGVIILSKKKRR